MQARDIEGTWPKVTKKRVRKRGEKSAAAKPQNMIPSVISKKSMDGGYFSRLTNASGVKSVCD